MSRRIGLGQRVYALDKDYLTWSVIYNIDPWSTNFVQEVTVHPRPEALWGWRMNQDGLRGGKCSLCSRQVISDKHLLYFPLNFFSLPPLLIKFSFEFSQANFPLIFYNVCCKMLPLSWHSFDDIAKLITTCCPNDGLAMAVAVGMR